MTKRGIPLIDRVMARVIKHPDGGCWEWTGPVQRGGYGNAASTVVHRIVYEAMVGPITEGLELDHLCHTNDPACPGGSGCPHRRCCNPAHLEQVSPRENVHRGRTNAAKTHCKWGHEFTPENIYVVKQGKYEYRQCRACQRRRKQEDKERREAA